MGDLDVCLVAYECKCFCLQRNINIHNLRTQIYCLQVKVQELANYMATLTVIY